LRYERYIADVFSDFNLELGWIGVELKRRVIFLGDNWQWNQRF